MIVPGPALKKVEGDTGEGPAVIDEHETSIVIGPDARFRVDAEHNIIIELDE